MPKSAWQQPGRFNNRTKAPRLDDLLPLHKFKSGVFYNLRFVGAPLTFAEHWIRIITNQGNETSVRKLCLSYDHASGDFKGKCPYCDTLGDTPRIVTLQNAIDRKLQKNEPARKPKPLKSETVLEHLPWADKDAGEFYFKEKDSETWTPVVPLRLTSSPSQRINDYAALNKHEDKKGNEVVYGPEDIDHGFDMQIKYDENQSAANAYFVNKAKNNYLTDEELDYPIYDLMVEEVEKFAVAQKNADELFEKLADTDGGKGGGKGGGRDDRGGKSGGKSRRDAKGYLGDIDDEDDDGDHRPGVDDNDDDDAPRGGRGGGRGRSRDDDDDPPARGRGRSRDDDDDPPARGRGGSRSRDDEDDEPRGGRGGGRGRSRDDDDDPPARSSRGRSSRDDDEDDAPRGRGRTSSRMDDYDDEPPARGRSGGGRGRSRDDDDDEPRGRGGRGGRRDDGLDLD